MFWGVFDGNGHTIKNFKVVESGRANNAQGYGFFGWANNTIKNLTFENATVEGHHNLGVIAGYQQFGKIVNCTVKNSTVTGTHVDNDLCGDKIGGIVGMSYNVQANGCDITNCKVENSTIKGGRDTGKIAGAAYEFEGKFDGCTATGTTLGRTSGCTGANMGAQLGGLVGRDC